MYLDGSGSNTGEFTTSPILTYQILGLDPATGTTGTTTWSLTLDRAVPDYSSLPGGTIGRVLIYPSGMTQLYDTVTPAPYWQNDSFNFESPCDVSQREITPIWNMNIPWSESPAGVFSNLYESRWVTLELKNIWVTNKIVVKLIQVLRSITIHLTIRLLLNQENKKPLQLFTTQINLLIMYMVRSLQQIHLTHKTQQLTQDWQEVSN